MTLELISHHLCPYVERAAITLREKNVAFDRIGVCDGIMLSTPEYAHGVAGAMKNALDWLVSSIEFAGKPTSV